MTENHTPVAIKAEDVPVRTRPSLYPEPFASRMQDREKKVLSDMFGFSNLVVNLTRLKPGGVSALRHAHLTQEEFVYVLEGTPTLLTDEGKTQLSPGMCSGFKPGTGNGHCLINESDADAVYLEAGDNTPGDQVIYPDDDLQAEWVDGKWVFTHKGGKGY